MKVNSRPLSGMLTLAKAVSRHMRARRFQWFVQLADYLPRPLHILDVGGTTAFWAEAGWAERSDIRIEVLNHTPEDRIYENIVPATGDATKLGRYADQSFDICFSNSVIEHLYSHENQRKMAAEVRRVGRSYWVQTPNFWFPIEPHFLAPGWQWLPIAVRVAILRRRGCGWRGALPDRDAARSRVEEIRLLSRRKLEQLFPGATIRGERFGGLVKSWVVYDGFQASPGRIITSRVGRRPERKLVVS